MPYVEAGWQQFTPTSTYKQIFNFNVDGVVFIIRASIVYSLHDYIWVNQ